MPEPTKPPVATAPAKEEAPKKPAQAELVPAGASGDPVIHQLLAERQAWWAAIDPAPGQEALDRAREHAQAEVDRIDGLLADLGYSAK